jgi:SHS2 domain-containing protein
MSRSGASVEAAFVNAALALSSVIVDSHAIGLQSSVDVRCEAPDLDMLLVCWLNEIVYEMSARRMLFGQFEVEIQANRSGWALAGRLTGEGIDPVRHQPAVEVKGATFTELAVRQEDGAWRAQCVVDV